jgi:glycosyl-4,4'-diaponeurosporenoate acyltransferase
MPISLPTGWVIALNIAGWPVIHLAVAKVFTRMPARWFRPENWLFRSRKWERDGRIYEKTAGVRRWKQLLPDGAPMLKGFAKKKLASADRAYLVAFIRETCRGEAAHWVMLAAAPLFFFWNPIWADAVMCLYAIAANAPCIITQRYNRIRLRRVAASRVDSDCANK